MSISGNRVRSLAVKQLKFVPPSGRSNLVFGAFDLPTILSEKRPKESG